MKSYKTRSMMTSLVIASMLCTAVMPLKAFESHWIENNGIWSYVKADGSKASGWINDGDCWYVFDNDGFMRTGWIASNEHWYFMGESGVMQSDAWVEDMGAWYFIKGTGIMAKDYVKDGYELTADGKAIPLNESNSLVINNSDNLEGKVIEGNLYIDASAVKEFELSGVTIKGKLVVVGDNITSGKIIVKDSVIETISNQTRGTEVILSGNAEIKHIVLEETADIKPDNKFKGEVDTFEIQSTVISDVNVEIPAHDVTTRTYAPIDINAPVDNLEVIVNTEINVNEDVKNIQVDESAKDTKLDVAKGSVVGTIVADAPIKIDGKGTVNKVEANTDGVEAGEDTIIKEVEKGNDVDKAPDENKPSGGGSGGGGYEPSVTDYRVSNEEQLRDALSKAVNGSVITLIDSFTIKNQINIENKSSFIIDGNNKTITFNKADPKSWDNNNAYILHFYNNTNQVTVKNIKLTGSNAALLVNGANVKLTGTVNVSGNGFGGIVVSKGTDASTSSQLDISNAVLTNDHESKNAPTIWMDKYSIDSESLTLIENSEQELHTRELTGEKDQKQFFIYPIGFRVASEEGLLYALENLEDGDTITLTTDISVAEENLDDELGINFNKNSILNINEHTLTLADGRGKISVLQSKELTINIEGKLKGAIYAASKFGKGSRLTINAGENAKVESQNDKGRAVYAGQNSTIIINGGTYESVKEGYVIEILSGCNITIRDAVVNVLSSSVIDSIGILSSASSNILENVIVNANYSSAADFNNKLGTVVIKGGKFKTTAFVPDYNISNGFFLSPTIRYQGTLDITDAEITRVYVGIQYNKSNPKPTEVENLTQKDCIFNAIRVDDNQFADVDFKR